MRYRLVCFFLVFCSTMGYAQSFDDAIDCTLCEQWNLPQAPFRIFGNTWYVGTRGLSALLITSPAGHILLDGALPQSAAQITANIQALGFAIDEVRYIGNSHAHFDHAGGLAALQRASGATVVASHSAARVLGAGMPGEDDPQYAYRDGFPAMAVVQPLDDGDTITVGAQDVVVHYTPGHTPGGTSWTWRSCDAERCLDLVYADSLSAVSAPGYRFSDHPAVVADLRAAMETVATLPCDIMVSTHPEFSGVFDKLARYEQGDADAFIAPSACSDYASAAATGLANRLASEQKGE